MCLYEEESELSFFQQFPYSYFKRGDFLDLRSTLFNTVSEDAGIEPRAVSSLALAVSRSNQSARSHIVIFFRKDRKKPL